MAVFCFKQLQVFLLLLGFCRMPTKYLEKPSFRRYQHACARLKWDMRWSMARLVPARNLKFQDGFKQGISYRYPVMDCPLLKNLKKMWSNDYVPHSLDDFGLCWIRGGRICKNLK